MVLSFDFFFGGWFFFSASVSVASRRKRSERLKGEQNPQGFCAGGLGGTTPNEQQMFGLCPDVCLARKISETTERA